VTIVGNTFACASVPNSQVEMAVALEEMVGVDVGLRIVEPLERAPLGPGEEQLVLRAGDERPALVLRRAALEVVLRQRAQPVDVDEVAGEHARANLLEESQRRVAQLP
jgi:hypothetical protein